VVESDGALHIKAQRTSDTTFTSARLKTSDQLYIKYATIEASIQIPDVRKGIWAAFWTLGQSFAQGLDLWPACGEFDVMEIGWAEAYKDAVANRLVLAAVHYERDGSNNPTISYKIPPHDLNTTFHTYRLEWTPQSVLVTVDNLDVLFVPDIASCGADGSCAELHQPHYLIFNLAVGGGFTHISGDPNDNTRITAPFPSTMKVDYVRVYDNGFTELSGSSIDGGGAPAPITAAPLPPQPVPPPTEPPGKLEVVDPSAPDPTNAPAVLSTLSPTTLAPVTPNPTTAAPSTVAPTTNPTVAPTTKEPTALPTSVPTDEASNIIPSTAPSIFAASELPSSSLTPSLRPTVVDPTSSPPPITTLPPTVSDPRSTEEDGSPTSSASLRRLWMIFSIILLATVAIIAISVY